MGENISELNKACWVDELKAYKNVITNRVIALNNIIGKLEGRSSPLLDLAMMWRNKLLVLLNEMNFVIKRMEEHDKVSSHVKACQLRDTVYTTMMEANPNDPIYNNLKHVIAGVLGVLENICK